MIKVGQKFQEERLRRELTLAQVEEATKIRAAFIDAIEKSEYSRLPSPAYAHGFVRNYAKFLNFPEDQTLALFRREFDLEREYEVLPKGFSKTSEFSIKRIRVNRTFILMGFGAILLLAFIIYQYRSAFINPPLLITEPREGAVIKSLSVRISGKTDPDSTVYIENEAVSLAKDGSFKKSVTFFPGNTTINIRSVNRFGKETVKQVPIEVKPGS